MFRPKPRYAHQGGMNPPVVVVHGNSLEGVTFRGSRTNRLSNTVAFTVAGADSIALGRLKVDADTVPGEFKYQLLVVQGGQRPVDFHGHVQIIVSAQHGAEKIVTALPPVADGR